MKRVIFIQIGTGFFAVDIDQAKRFIANVEILDLNDKSDDPSIIGLLWLDDETIPVLNSHKWFGQEQISMSNQTLFLIMMLGDKSFTFQVSAVMETAEVPDECFRAIPFCMHESAGMFREIIDLEGRSYLKISAEMILNEMNNNTR